MTDTPFVVGPLMAGQRCARCRFPFKEGEAAFARVGEGWAEQVHAACPSPRYPSSAELASRVIQGSDGKRAT